MLVSIITATFNSAKTLPKALEGLRCQLYPYKEHIIIDGGSTDETLSIIESYKASVSYQVKVISESDDGIYDALNKGLRIAEGDVIGILHSDDFWSDTGLLNNVVRVLATTDADGCYGDCVFVDREETNRVLRVWHGGEFDKDKFLEGWMPPHTSCFFRKRVYQLYGEFDKSFPISADYDFLIRAIYKGATKIVYVPEIKIFIRVGGKSNKSVFSYIASLIENYKILRKNGFPPVLSLKIALLKKLNKIGQFIYSKQSNAS